MGAPKLSELIEALQIFLKYGDAEFPTHCEHDQMRMCNVATHLITSEDARRLEKLGFEYDENEGNFRSYAFGSA